MLLLVRPSIWSSLTIAQKQKTEVPLVHVKKTINYTGLELAELSLVQHTILVALTQKSTWLASERRAIKIQNVASLYMKTDQIFLSCICLVSLNFFPRRPKLRFWVRKILCEVCHRHFSRRADALLFLIICGFSMYFLPWYQDNFYFSKIFPLLSMWSVSLKTKLFWSLSVSCTTHNHLLPLRIFLWYLLSILYYFNDWE